MSTTVCQLRSESGQVTVLIALVSVALLSSLALVVDVGAGYEARRALQNSVDAAALAGAQDIAEQRGELAARQTAENYMALNSGPAAGRTVVAFPDGERVRVEATIDQGTFFARLFGRRSFPVKAAATASIGAAGQVENLVPIIVPYQSVAGHIGEGNPAVYELGEDRPLESLSITYAQSGNRVTYTVSYINTDNKAVNLDMWSPIPSGAVYVSGSADGGGSFDGTKIDWRWADVAAGDRRSASFSVSFSESVNPRNEVWVLLNGQQTQTASTDSSQRGFFWLVDFDGASNPTPDFADWIINGYPNPVSVGDAANGTGVRASLKEALVERMANDPKVILPLYDYTAGGGSTGEYHVVGFAEFVITGFNLNGNPKTISGHFTNGTVTAGFGGNPGAVDYGVRVVWLSD